MVELDIYQINDVNYIDQFYQNEDFNINWIKCWSWTSIISI